MSEEIKKCETAAPASLPRPAFIALGGAAIGAVLTALVVCLGGRPSKPLESGERRRRSSRWSPEQEGVFAAYPDQEAFSLYGAIKQDADRLADLEVERGLEPPPFSITWGKRGPYRPPSASEPWERDYGFVKRQPDRWPT